MLDFFQTKDPTQPGFAHYVYLDIGQDEVLVVDDPVTEHGQELYKTVSVGDMHRYPLGEAEALVYTQKLIDHLQRGVKDHIMICSLKDFQDYLKTR